MVAMRGSRVLLFGVFAVLLATLVLASPSYAYKQDFDKTYPLEPGGSVELQNVNGSVELSGWDRNEVQVRAVKTARRNEADLTRVTIEVAAKPSAVAVMTRYPQDQGVEVAVDYAIRVPHGARLKLISTVNGAVRISGVENAGELRTVNGDIEVYDSAGPVTAHATNGNVHLELHRFNDTGAASAETTNGSIVLAIPFGTRADLEARSMNGDFWSELPLSLESSLWPREVRGKIGGGGGSIRLRTVNGGIRVVVLRSTV
jgi:DUF4097 and DUF4098 domain-containing protein YvlB